MDILADELVPQIGITMCNLAVRRKLLVSRVLVVPAIIQKTRVVRHKAVPVPKDFLRHCLVGDVEVEN
jgi:hypothetical protein